MDTRSVLLAPYGRGSARAYNIALTYLITFACYGCHLHGDPAGSIDRKHNLPRQPACGRRFEAGFRRMPVDEPAALLYGPKSPGRRAYLTSLTLRTAKLDTARRSCTQQ